MRQRDGAFTRQVPRLLESRGKLSNGFPDKMISQLRYHTNGTITSTLGGVSSYFFRWNSTFDPDVNSVGHQPLYRDIFASIYDQYAVISCKAVVKFTNNQTSAMMVGCVTEDDGSGSTTLDTLCEQHSGVHMMLPPISGSLSSHTFNLSWDCKKVLNIDPFTSELYKTAVGLNPTEGSQLSLWAATTDLTTSSINFDIELVYQVLWTELTTPIRS